MVRLKLHDGLTTRIPFISIFYFFFYIFAEYYRQYEVGTDLTTKNVIQNEEFRCLDLSDGLSDQKTIQELEHFVTDPNLPNNETYRAYVGVSLKPRKIL